MACSIYDLSVSKVNPCNIVDTHVSVSFRINNQCSADGEFFLYIDNVFQGSCGSFDPKVIAGNASLGAHTFRINAVAWSPYPPAHWVVYATSGNISLTVPNSLISSLSSSWTPLSTNVILNWSNACSSSIDSYTIQKYVGGSWTNWKTGINKNLTTYTTTGNTLFSDVTYRIASVLGSDLYYSNSVTTSLYYLNTPIIQANIKFGDYPTLTFTARTTNFDSNCQEVNWYIDGVLDGNSTGATYTSVLPEPIYYHILTAKNKRDSYLSPESNQIKLGFILEIRSGFTTNRTITIPSGYTYMDYLIVGGGGSGAGTVYIDHYFAFAGGGGGAGGVKHGRVSNPTPGSYSVVVGSGGTTQKNGGNSSFFGYTAYGGGYGNNVYPYNATSGGSGGGGTYYEIWRGSGGASASGQGNNGYQAVNIDAGGGGGAGSASTNKTGGAGYTTSITGNNYTFSKGGNGAVANDNLNGNSGVKYGDGGNGACKIGSFYGTYTGGNGKQGYVYLRLYNPDYINAPTNLVENGITDNSILLSWNNNNNNFVDGNYIQKLSGLTWINIFDVSSATTTYNITGLTPATSYSFRVAAYNNNHVVPSISTTFTTLDSIPSVTTSGTTVIDLNLASCGGNATTGTNITAKGCCWSTSSNPTIANSHSINGSGTGAFLSYLNSLSNNVIYYVRAYVSNSRGTFYGNQETTTIPLSAPSLSGYTANLNTYLSWTDPNTEHEKYQIWKTTSCFPEQKNVLGYYSFDATTGENSVGSYVDMSIGANYTSYGKIGKGLNFNTFNQYAAIGGTAGRFERTDKFSYGFWFSQNQQSYTTDEEFLIYNIKNGKGYSVSLTYVSGGASGGGIQYIYNLNFALYHSPTDYIKVTRQISIGDNYWQYLTVTYDGSSNSSGLKMYLNGNLLTSTPSGTLTDSILDGSNVLFIANDIPPYDPPHEPPSYPPSNLFYGRIDEFCVWNINISQASITSLYNAGAGNQYKPTTALLVTVDYPTLSYVDSGLTVGCNYSYCVKAFYDSYTPDIISTCSNQVVSGISPILSATDLVASDVTVTGCTLTWTNNNPLSAFTGIYVQVLVGATWTTIATLGNTAITYDVTGLNPATQYQFRIGTYNINQTVYSSVAIINTIDPTPYNLGGTVKNNTFTASWFLPVGGYGTDIRCEYRLSGQTAWSVQKHLTNVSTGYTYTGLSYISYYQVRVVLVGSEYPSNIYTFLTPTLYLPIVITRPISGSSSGGIITFDGNTDITAKGVCWYTSANPTIINSHTINGTGSTTYSSIMTDLIPNTQYHVRAYATNVVGTGYGQDLYFTTEGQYCDTYIRFEDNILYDLEVPDFEVHFALNDIQNFNEAKTSYTIPIKIPYTPRVAEIFGTLFNVNNQSQATDIQIDCRLIYKDKVIINGYCFVNYVTFDYIYIIIARSDLNIYESIKDFKLSDLVFSGSGYTYHHLTNYHTNPVVDSYVKQNDTYHYSADTADYHFINVDWKGYANQSLALTLDWKKTSKALSASNRLTPVIRVKTVLDKIISTQGYTYSASTKILDTLDGLFMSTDAPVSNYCNNAVSKFLFSGLFTDNNYGSPVAHSGTGLQYFQPKQISGVSMSYNYKSTKSFTPTGNRHMMPIYPFSIFDNEYNINLYINAYATGAGSVKFYLHKWFSMVGYRDDDPECTQDIPIGTITFNGATPTQVYNLKTTITPSIDDVFSKKILNHNINDGGYYVRIEYENANTVLTWTPPNYPALTITCNNWLYDTGHTFTLTDLLPTSYTQFQFLNDLLNILNVYVYVDEVNKKILHFETYEDFYTGQVLDWSKKFTTDKLEVYDTSQKLNDTYIVTLGDNQDSIGKSFKAKTNDILNQKTILNNNPLAINNDNIVKTSLCEAILTSDLLLPSTRYITQYNYTDNNYYICSAIGSENSKIMYGYINKFNLGKTNPKYFNDGYEGGILTTIHYDDESIYYVGVDNHILQMSKINNYLTLSPFRLTGETISNGTTYKGSDLNQISNGQTFVMLLDSTNQYLGNPLGVDPYLKQYTGTTITNKTIYNEFWKADMESKLFTQQKFLRAYLKLYPNDVKITNFKKRIWIDNDKLGGAYYILNQIVFPSDETKTSYTELITDLNFIPSYSATTPVQLYSYNYTDGSTNKYMPPYTGSTGTTTGTTINFASVSPEGYIVAGSADGIGKTFTVNLWYAVGCNCDVQTPGEYNQSSAEIMYSLNGGVLGSWISMATAFCEITGSSTSASITVTGLTTITGVTDVQQLRFAGNWSYNVGPSGAGGGYELWLQTASTDVGTVVVLCNNFAQAGGSLVEPYLSCTIV